MGENVEVCPKCAASNPEISRFCGQCGSQISFSCPACEGAIKVGESYCSSCGREAKPSSAKARCEAAAMEIVMVGVASLSGRGYVAPRIPQATSQQWRDRFSIPSHERLLAVLEGFETVLVFTSSAVYYVNAGTYLRPYGFTWMTEWIHYSLGVAPPSSGRIPYSKLPDYEITRYRLASVLVGDKHQIGMRGASRSILAELLSELKSVSAAGMDVEEQSGGSEPREDASFSTRGVSSNVKADRSRHGGLEDNLSVSVDGEWSTNLEQLTKTGRRIPVYLWILAAVPTFLVCWFSSALALGWLLGDLTFFVAIALTAILLEGVTQSLEELIRSGKEPPSGESTRDEQSRNLIKDQLREFFIGAKAVRDRVQKHGFVGAWSLGKAPSKAEMKFLVVLAVTIFLVLAAIWRK